MTRLRLLPFKELSKLLKYNGFTDIRCVGSHHTFRNQSGKTIVIPDHGSQVIVRPLLRKILRDMEMTVEEYNAWLDKQK